MQGGEHGVSVQALLRKQAAFVGRIRKAQLMYTLHGPLGNSAHAVQEWLSDPCTGNLHLVVKGMQSRHAVCAPPDMPYTEAAPDHSSKLPLPP